MQYTYIYCIINFTLQNIHKDILVLLAHLSFKNIKIIVLKSGIKAPVFCPVVAMGYWGSSRLRIQHSVLEEARQLLFLLLCGRRQKQRPCWCSDTIYKGTT